MIHFFLSKISWQEYDARQTSYYDSRKTEVHLKSLPRSALSPLVTSFCTLLRGLGSCDLFPHYSLRYLSFKMPGGRGKWWCGLEVPNEPIHCIPMYDTKLTSQDQLLSLWYSLVTHAARFRANKPASEILYPFQEANVPVVLWAPQWRSDGAVVSAHLVLIWVRAGYVHTGQLCGVHY